MPKTQKNIPNTMCAWLWKAPVKFAGLLVGGMLAIILLMSLIAIPFAKTPMPDFVAYIIMTVIAAYAAFCIYKLVRFAPNENLDRRSFVALDVGITLLAILFYIVLPLGLVLTLGLPGLGSLLMFMGLYFNMLVQTNAILFFVIIFFVSLITMYVTGAMLLNYVAIYHRGRKMGISKLRMILSFPFGMRLVWLPGFLIPEDKKQKEVLAVKSKWFSGFIDWIVAKPINTMIVWLVMLSFAVIMPVLFGFGWADILIEALIILLFAVPLAIIGMKNFKKAIPGWFSALAVGLNIVLVVLYLTMYAVGMANFAKNQNAPTAADSVYVEYVE